MEFHIFRIRNSTMYMDKQMTEQEMIEKIDFLDFRYILKNQTLSLHFVRNYLLNPLYHSSVEDSYITWNDVLFYQPHIQKELNKESLLD